MNPYIPLNTALIDSLKLRMSLEKIKVLDRRFTDSYMKYYEDMELLDGEPLENQIALGFAEKHNPDPFVHITDTGITYRYYKKSFITSEKTVKPFVVIQVSAKMLKERYFEGITKYNYKNILDDINAFGIIRVSERVFLDALVSDIDICVNGLVDQKSMQDSFTFMELNAKKGANSLMYRHKTGLEFNKREKATNARPYVKIYHKGFELMSKSHSFYRSYLEPMRTAIIDNLIRLEFTIKASRHKKYLKEKGFESEFITFQDLLSTPSKELKKIAESGIPKYCGVKEQISRKKVKNDSPTDAFIKGLMQELINNGYDEERIIQTNHLFSCKVTRSRMKTKARKLLKSLTENDTYNKTMLERNKGTHKALKMFGLKINK